MRTLTRDSEEKDGSEAPRRGSEHNNQTPRKDREKMHWGEALWTHTEDAEEKRWGLRKRTRWGKGVVTCIWEKMKTRERRRGEAVKTLLIDTQERQGSLALGRSTVYIEGAVVRHRGRTE